MNLAEEYRRKLRTPEEAVRAVKSGDWVDYTMSLTFPTLLDRALAARRDELRDVKVRGNLIFDPIQVVECDPEQAHFLYQTWHCSAYERRMADQGRCSYIPISYRDLVPHYRDFLTVNVAMAAVTPMDAHGYFNLSASVGFNKGILEKADIVIAEVNERLPWVCGGFGEVVHLSEVDFVVEGEHPPLPQLLTPKPSAEDALIAGHVLPYLRSGDALQLGIGAVPDVLGTLAAESELRDLSMFTELCSDAYLKLFRAGKLTNRGRGPGQGKGVLGVAIGSHALYEWLDHNPGIAGCPLEFVNDPRTLSQVESLVSINGCISADLYGQVNAESSGLRHISGSGGQLDFLTGAPLSHGGKSFICMTSTYTDATGQRRSRILPHFSGEIVTSPRSKVFYLVTEYGAVNLMGLSAWDRAEAMISLAHPDFRQELIAAAEAQKLWRRSNRR